MKDFTKEDLERLYIKELKTSREIAKIYECSPGTVVRRLRDFGIEVKSTGNYKDKEYHLVSPFKQYVTDDDKLTKLFNDYVSIKKISKELGICERAVSRRVKELGLSRDNGKMMSREQYNSSNDSEIIRLYNEGKSTTEIGKIFNVGHQIILEHLKHCGVKRRTLSESQFNYNKKEYPKELKSFEAMYDLYVVNKMTKKELSNMFGVATRVIDRVLKEFNIHVRGCSEARKGLFAGTEAGNYKDGRTPLYARLRMFFRTWQPKERIKVDEGKCQICGSRKHLHVHHIKPFKEIFEEILSEHTDLDVQRDSDKLYEIMTNDFRMNDMNNLITYCKECHLFKVHGYKKKTINLED